VVLFQLRRRSNGTNRAKSKRSPRKGKAKKWNTRIPESVTLLSEEKKGDATPYSPFKYRLKPGTYVPGYRLRLSTRWIPDYSPSCRRIFSLPFINKVGKMSTLPVATWKVHPLQHITTLASTIFSRLQRVLIKRHGGRIAFGKIQSSTLRAAVCYAVSNDSWIIDRFLGITKKPTNKKFSALLRKAVCKLDADERFVYSQATSYGVANWLTFRALRPCDKSRIEEPPPLIPNEEQEVECPCKRGFCPWGSLCTTDFPRKRSPSVEVSNILTKTSLVKSVEEPTRKTQKSIQEMLDSYFRFAEI